MLLLTFCLLDLSISGRGVLKSPSVTIDLCVSSCSSICFCLTYFDALLLGVYLSRIVVSSFGVSPSLLCKAPLYPR